MKPTTCTLAAAVLAVAALTLLPAAPASAGDFRPDVVDDFDCDGIRDVVYGVDYETVGGAEWAGAVYVTYSTTGVEKKYTQASAGIPGSAEEWDQFGQTTASYDRDGDGCDDLVVGSPGESLGPDTKAGSIHIIPGSRTGLNTAKTVSYNQDSPGVPGSPEDYDSFGDTLAAGTTSSGKPYLLVSAPDESFDAEDEGTVYYFRDNVWRTISQDSPGVPGSSESFDSFGETLAVSDRYFAIGVPSESLGSDDFAGTVHVFSHTIVDGAPKHIAAVNQDTAGISGSAEDDDEFGRSISVVSYRSSPSAAISALLAVGTPYEDLRDNTVDQAGSAHLINVTDSGKVTQLAELTQDTPGIPGVPGYADDLGSAVLVANRGTGSVATPSTAVWAVAVPWEPNPGGEPGTGLPVIHLTRADKTPGDGDVLLTEADFNGYADFQNPEFDASSKTLHVTSLWGSIAERPWAELPPT
ncbi:integrin alpha [Phytomonospora sp. NPDC050363]|uniref:integrin alpha n=1 Tax=Phytomonospora sp. NPDC050363 TaxID=3155642 RepID=UPI0033C567B1